MPNTVQETYAAAALKASEDLAAALLNIPEDKRAWQPGKNARTALDQIAECALLNGYTADLLETHIWQVTDFDAYFREKTALAAVDWDTLHTRLRDNAQRVAEAIGTLSDEDLAVEVETPWRKQTLAEIIAYPHWNMTYHEGQINFIASMLGCLT